MGALKSASEYKYRGITMQRNPGPVQVLQVYEVIATAGDCDSSQPILSALHLSTLSRGLSKLPPALLDNEVMTHIGYSVPTRVRA